jgi:hypothetical protein
MIAANSDMIDIAAVFRVGVDEQFVDRLRFADQALSLAIVNDSF